MFLASNDNIMVHFDVRKTDKLRKMKNKMSSKLNHPHTYTYTSVEHNYLQCVHVMQQWTIHSSYHSWSPCLQIGMDCMDQVARPCRNACIPQKLSST